MACFLEHGPDKIYLNAQELGSGAPDGQAAWPPSGPTPSPTWNPLGYLVVRPCALARLSRQPARAPGSFLPLTFSGSSFVSRTCVSHRSVPFVDVRCKLRDPQCPPPVRQKREHFLCAEGHLAQCGLQSMCNKFMPPSFVQAIAEDCNRGARKAVSCRCLNCSVQRVRGPGCRPACQVTSPFHLHAA